MKKILVLLVIGAISVLAIGSVMAKLAAPTYQQRTAPSLQPAAIQAVSTGWQTMGTGAGGGTIACLKLDSDNSGNIYAGAANGVYRWDFASSSWSQIGSEISRALVYDKMHNLLYSATETAVKKWNGSTWTQLGDNFTGGNVFTLAIDPWGNLYAGGTFKVTNDVSRGRIARWNWNATSWSYIDNGSIFGDTCYSIFYAGGTIYGGGDSGVYVHGQSTPSVGWTQMPGIRPCKYLTYDRYGKVYATDGYSIYSWNNTSRLFEKVTASYPWGAAYEGNTTIRTIAFDSANNLYVGGNFSKTSGISVTSYTVAKLTGSTLVPVDGENLLGACWSLIFSRGSLYSAGLFGGQYKGKFNTNIVRGSSFK